MSNLGIVPIKMKEGQFFADSFDIFCKRHPSFRIHRAKAVLSKEAPQYIDVSVSPKQRPSAGKTNNLQSEKRNSKNLLTNG